MIISGTTGDLFDPPEGERRRDEGMKKVLSHNVDWQEFTLDKLRIYSNAKAGLEFNPQQFRIWYERNDGPQPKHFNGWGAMWNGAVRQGIVIRTDRTVKAVMPQSNATQLPIYIGRAFRDQLP